MRDSNERILAVTTETITGYLWLMFVICFVGNILGGTTSTLMSVYLPQVSGDLLGAVSESQLNRVSATISALYFAGWTIGGLTWGIIGDYIGRSRSLALAVGMFGLFTFLTGFASSWEQIVVLRFLCGFGVGGTLVINTTLLSEVWPVSTRAIFIGILSIGFPVGIISSGIVNYIVPNWRHGFMTGIIPFLVGIASIWVLKESEKWKHSRTLMENSASKASLRYHRKDLVNGSIVFGSMLIGLWAVFSWVPTWVQSLLLNGDGQHERGLSMMTLGLGGLAGGFSSGWIANGLGTRKAMLLSFMGCFIMSVLLFKGNTAFSITILVELAMLAFMFGISQGLLSVYIPLLFPVAIRARATGFCFNIGRFVTSAAIFFVGALVLTLGGYGNSLFAFSFVFLFGFIILLLSKNLTKEGNGTH